MKVEIGIDYPAVCRRVATRIAALIREKPDAVLGLATGTTPIGVYDELIRLHRQEGLSFASVRVFNLDEYFPLPASAPQSYFRFMRQNLFDHIDIDPANCHIPTGEIRTETEVEADCIRYEQEIARAGRIDFQLLGIGRNGHIGFNEPGSAETSRTRLVTLESTTRRDAAADFFGLENVPVRAISMGVGTILEAREIALIASGAGKAPVLREAIEGKITSKVPASFLRQHPDATFFLDEAASSLLVENLRPWNAPGADMRKGNLRLRAVLSACQESGHALADLSRQDLASAGAAQLALTEDALEKTKSAVIAELRAKMDDERHLPAGKTVLCLSPHPDDDVVCCGATLLKMAARKNRVYVVYGVSGANAVRDKDVLALLRANHPRLIAYLEEHLEPGKSLSDAVNEVRTSIFEREPGAPDAPLLRELKRLLREGEAADACRKMGARPVFLNLPFYGDGAHREPPSEADTEIMREALARINPDIVMLTGELSDPHGTHELCARVFDDAAQELREERDWKFSRWLYRGAYLDWPLAEAGYFSLFDKPMMDNKIGLILDHISQLDPLFPGGDVREFWERARDRNRQSARELQALGLVPPTRSFAPIYAEVFVIE